MLYNPCYVITIGSNLFSWKLSCTDFIKERYSVRILLKYMKMDSTLISHFNNNNNNNNNKFNRSYINEIKLENWRMFWRICNVLTRNESTFVISVFFEGHSRLRHPPDIFSTIVPSFEISRSISHSHEFRIFTSKFVTSLNWNIHLDIGRFSHAPITDIDIRAGQILDFVAGWWRTATMCVFRLYERK